MRRTAAERRRVLEAVAAGASVASAASAAGVPQSTAYHWLARERGRRLRARLSQQITGPVEPLPWWWRIYDVPLEDR